MIERTTEVSAPSFQLDSQLGLFLVPAQALLDTYREELDEYRLTGVITAKGPYFFQPQDFNEPVSPQNLELFRSKEVPLTPEQNELVGYYRELAHEVLKIMVTTQPDIAAYIEHESLFPYTDTGVRDGAMSTAFVRIQTSSNGPSQISMIVPERLRAFFTLRQAHHIMSLRTFHESTCERPYLKIISLVGLEHVLHILPRLSIPLDEDKRRRHSYL